MNESQLVAKIAAAIKARYPGAWVFKVAGSGYQRTGIPDLLVVVSGRLVGLEVKHQKPGESLAHARGRTTALQRQQIAALRRAGAVAGVVTSVAEALAQVAAAVTAPHRSRSQDPAPGARMV